MDLTMTEKYVLTVLDAYGKLSALKKQEHALCLAVSCVWEMQQAGAVAPDKKDRLMVCAPLPAALSYCGPVYGWLAKNPRRPAKAAYRYSWTPKRIKLLVKSVTNVLIEKSVLVLEQPNSQAKAGRCHVDSELIANDIAAIRQLDEAVTSEQLDLAALLLESGTAKKLLSKQERSALKKAVRSFDSAFKAYLQETMKVYWTAKTILWASIGTSAST